MIYELPELPYSSDALAPIISRETIEYHYGKHERTYIDNLNRLIKDTEYEDMELEDIIRLPECQYSAPDGYGCQKTKTANCS